MKNLQSNLQCVDIYKTTKKIRVDGESTLPDYCSDIMRVLKAEAMPVITSKKAYIRDNTLFCELEGKVIFNVIYCTDTQESESYSFSEDFSDSSRAEVGNIDADSLCAMLSSDVENVVCKVQSPRRISARAELVLKLGVKANVSFESFVKSDEKIEGIQREVYSTRIASSKDAEFKVSEEIKLPKSCPAMERILSARLELSCDEASAGDNSVNFWGNAAIHCLYLPDSESEGGIQSFYQPLEIKGSVEMDDSRGDMIASVSLIGGALDYEIMSDALGENKVLKVEFGYTAQCMCEENSPIVITEDIYGIGCEATPSYDRRELSRYVGRLSESTAIKEKLPLKKGVRSIEGAMANTTVKDTYFENGELYANCRIGISGLGIGENGAEPIYESFDIALHLNLPSEVAVVSDGLTFELSQTTGFVDARANGDDMSVSFDITTHANMYYNEETSFVSAVDVGETREVRDGVVFYYPVDADTLWTVGKRYGVSREALAKANSLEANGNLRRVLIIPAE